MSVVGFAMSRTAAVSGRNRAASVDLMRSTPGEIIVDIAMSTVIDTNALRVAAASAIDAVLHLRRDADGHRWVSEVGVLTRARGPLECALALSATADGCVTTHEAWASLAQRVGL